MNEGPQIQTGPARVISSGSATTFGGAGMALHLSVDGVPFDLVLQFATDESVEDVDVRLEPIDTGLILTCVNFDTAEGRGSAVPVALGSVGDDVVFAHFRVFRHGRTSDRTIHYTFFRAARAILD